jgi:hypothetical protein
MAISILMAAGALGACASDAAPGGETSGAAGSATSTTSAGSTGDSTVGSGSSSASTSAATGAGGSSDSTSATTTGASTGAGGTNGTGGSGAGGSAGGPLDAGSGSDSSSGGSGGGGPGGDGGIISIFNGSNLDAWIQKPADSWTIMDMAMYGKGTARGFVYTKQNFTDYRVIFTLRQVSGDHKPTVLVYNATPNADAMGGVQFQPPQGGHWDYRLPTSMHNNAGNQYFTTVNSGSSISTSMWSRCEILVLATGTARMACCQLPTGTGACKSLEILAFKDDPKNLATTGPFAIQVHNGGIHDEYKDITIEQNPAVRDLITNK